MGTLPERVLYAKETYFVLIRKAQGLFSPEKQGPPRLEGDNG